MAAGVSHPAEKPDSLIERDDIQGTTVCRRRIAVGDLFPPAFHELP